MTYETIKQKVGEQKGKVMTGVALAVMFIVGFGTGRTVPQKSASPSNYTPPTAEKPVKAEKTPKADAPSPSTIAPAEDTPVSKPQTNLTKPKPGEPCPIKGNVSGKRKIYHVPG